MHGRLGNLILLLTSTLLCLCVSEVGLRLVGVTPEERPYRFHSTLGWVPKPSSETFRSTPWFAHFVHFNVDGFPTTPEGMNDSVSRTRPSIALIGDSHAEGYGLPYRESFAHLLSQSLAGYQLLNLGVAGYSPEQYLLRARQALPGFEVVGALVVFFAYNDLEGLDRPVYAARYSKPVFGDDFDVPINTPLQDLAAGGSRSLFRSFVRNTALYTFIRPVYRTYIAPLETDTFAREGDEYIFSRSKMRRAVAMIAAIRETIPQAGFAITYLPSYPELVSDAFGRNREAFLEACKREAVACHVPDYFSTMTEEKLLEQFVDPLRGEDHLTELGAARYARFLQDVAGVLVEIPGRHR